jgi:ubiquinone/menaquinone biosynthesis C-methylase UbiE
MAVYDKIAEIYDETRGHEAESLARFVVAWLGGAPSTVLDIGVGTGLTIPLIEAAGHSVIGVDVSGEMLLRARRRCADSALIQADAVHLPLRSDTFKRAIALQVFQLVPEPTFLLADHPAVSVPGRPAHRCTDRHR